MYQCTDERGYCGCACDGTSYTELSGGEAVAVEMSHRAGVVVSGLVEAVIIIPTSVAQIAPASVMHPSRGLSFFRQCKGTAFWGDLY